MTQVELPNIEYASVILKNVRNNIQYDLIAAQNNASGYIMFESIILTEDLFNPHIIGALTINDGSNIFDSLGLKAEDEILINVRFLDSNTSGLKNYKFKIIDIATSSDLASQQIFGPAGNVQKVILRFGSEDFSYKNFTIDFGENFIGPISKEAVSLIPLEKQQVSVTCIEKTAEYTPVTDSFYVPKQSWESANSFMDLLYVRFNKNKQVKPFETHPSYNDVWLKPEVFTYPWYKTSSHDRITKVVNYITEFTCLKEDPTKFDFLFWEDLDKYNFKSLSKLATEQKERGEYWVYYPTVDENDKYGILSMELISELTPIELIDAGALFSEYIRVKPNWPNPYRSFLGPDEQLIKKRIQYSYKTHIKRPSIANFPPFTQELINNNYEALRGEQIDSSNMRFSDEVYGYYSQPYNSKNVPWFYYLDNLSYGYKTADLPGFSRQPPSPNFNWSRRFDEEYWQAQYDFSELPGGGVYKAYKNIKWKVNTARQEYAIKKNLKKKWEVYKNSICCERKVPLNFFALITGAQKYYGEKQEPGTTFANTDFPVMYAYDWMEVEFWPRSDAQTILENGEEIIKFDNYEAYPFVFVKPRGGLEGHGIVEKIYNPLQQRYEDKTQITVNDAGGFQDPSFGGEFEDPNMIGLGKGNIGGIIWSAFPGGEPFPPDIIPFTLPGGWEAPNTTATETDPTNARSYLKKIGEKYFTKDTRAFNLNEILNTIGLTANSEALFGAGSSILEVLNKCKTVFTNPGVSNVISKPSESATCITSYPRAFKMMPVGKFKVVGRCSDNTQEMFGRIVQMHAIPKDIMQTIAKFGDGVTLDPELNYDNQHTKDSYNISVNLNEDDEIPFKAVKQPNPVGLKTVKVNINSETKEENTVEKDTQELVLKLLDLEQQKESINKRPYLFVFDVENAHDGLCDGTC